MDRWSSPRQEEKCRMPQAEFEGVRPSEHWRGAAEPEAKEGLGPPLEVHHDHCPPSAAPPADSVTSEVGLQQARPPAQRGDN